MAKYEKVVHGNFDQILKTICDAVMEGSQSATYEDGSDYRDGDYRCAVRVFERYSWSGGNRVSMSITMAGRDGNYFLSVITAGGSKGIIMKLNRWGEEAFLETIAGVIDSL